MNSIKKEIAMNIKILTLITTLSLFAGNDVTANQFKSNSPKLNDETTLLELMPLVCAACNKENTNMAITFPCNYLNQNNLKTTKLVSIKGYRNLISWGRIFNHVNDIATAVNLSPEKKEQCFKQMSEALLIFNREVSHFEYKYYEEKNKAGSTFCSSFNKEMEQTEKAVQQMIRINDLRDYEYYKSIRKSQ
jgi:hypothetical protein